MRIVNTEYQIDILLKENEVNVLVGESQRAYQSLVNDFWVQYNGGVGTWILSDNNKSLNISKNLNFIINPFSIEINDKTIINKLYQELKYLSDENLLMETAEVNTNIVHYLDKLIFLTSYPLAFNVDFNLLNLLKIYDMKIDTNFCSFLEKIVEYIKIVNQICHVDIFVFVGLKQYLSKDELEQLYESVFYNKIHLLLLESRQYDILNNENVFIIDKDLCIINVKG